MHPQLTQQPNESRFWSKVLRREGSCWEWTGPTDGHGYGSLHFNGATRKAHRVSWMIHFGDIPSGLAVCHRCDNPACVRPDHLFLGTQRENMVDMFTKGRANTAKGVRAARAKLTEDDVREIRRLHATGTYSHRALARRFGVVKSAIDSVLYGLTWKHVE